MTQRVAMVGSGLIGTGWAVVFARAGWEVALYDIQPGKVEKAQANASAALKLLEQAGLMTGADAAIERISTSSSLVQVLKGATYVQENVLETPEEKFEIFAELDSLVAAEIVLGSSTSTIPASRFSEKLKTRERCIVVHPMTPPYLVPVVEIVPAPWTAQWVTDYAMKLMADVQMSPILLHKEIFGFVLNRFQVGIINEAMYLVSQGVASPEDIEKTLSRAWI